FDQSGTINQDGANRDGDNGLSTARPRRRFITRLKEILNMPKYWMISDRTVDRQNGQFGGDCGQLSYWVSDGGPRGQFVSWRETNEGDFEKSIEDAVGTFPPIIDAAHQQEQKHITLFVHGYNNTWQQEAQRYQAICASLFDGPDSMGICIWFDWPSKG